MDFFSDPEMAPDNKMLILHNSQYYQHQHTPFLPSAVSYYQEPSALQNPSTFMPTDPTQPAPDQLAPSNILYQELPAAWNPLNPLPLNLPPHSQLGDPATNMDHHTTMNATTGAPVGQQQLQSEPASEQPTSYFIQKFQRDLQKAVYHIQNGQHLEARQLIMSITEWLSETIINAGILRDDQIPYADQLKLWDDFNICWLATLQKQEDMIQESLQTNRQSLSLPNSEELEKLGKRLIEICDSLEQYGLVDYTLGIWEEQILSAIERSLKLLRNARTHAQGRVTIQE
ncbi:uncharacterized protein BDW70DRAFT_164961 [Aspergillus foveolatus]|uniref:uncharacterized protein n=1 Tax=Aspergillus foveolatus TaxID=210207 RepID=UPI003CCE13AC